jgi:FkbM family methyltransferase
MGALRFYLHTFGKRGIIVAFLSRISKYTNQSLIISVPPFMNKRYSVFVRLRTSDSSIFREIFVDNRLDLELSRSPRVIIDAGAYTGLSSVYFAVRYPDAKVIAIEPEKSNFDILARNVKPFTNILPIKAALWKEETELNLYDPGRGQCGYQALDSEPQEEKIQSVSSVTIEKIMLNHDIEFIDILKLDIEGAEKEVLEFSENWIHKIGVLIVELHDWFRNGCEESFNAATSDFEYEEKRQGRIIRMRKEFAPNKTLQRTR